jgi:hypothetical protein
MVVAAIFAVGAFGQALIEFETRIKLQTVVGQSAMPAEEKVLRRERMSMQGGMIRMDSGDQFLLYDIAKRSVVLAADASKSFVRASREEFARSLKLQRPLAATSNTVEILEAPPVPSYVWKGKETTASSCRYKYQMPKGPVAAEAIMFVYSLPFQGPMAEAQSVLQQLQLDMRAEAGDAMGFAIVAACFPRNRVLVRTVTQVESRISAPRELRVVAEVVLEVLRYEEGPLAADLFVVPQGWTEEPASSLQRRVLQYLNGPAAIQ